MANYDCDKLSRISRNEFAREPAGAGASPDSAAKTQVQVADYIQK